MSVDFYSNSKIREPSELNAVDNSHDPDELGQLCFVSFNFSMKTKAPLTPTFWYSLHRQHWLATDAGFFESCLTTLS